MGSQQPPTPSSSRGSAPLDRAGIGRRIAADLPTGSYVNLGIGLPTIVADFLDPSKAVVLQTENGMLGMGPNATTELADPDLINAGKVPVTETPGASYFDHTVSFGMICGGHIDVCVLGAYQVSVDGDLANWHSGAADAIPAVGGAMDLAVGAREVWVAMTLFEQRRPKLVNSCNYPLTAGRCVGKVYTDWAVFDLRRAHGVVTVTETFGCTIDDLVRWLDVPLQGIDDG